MRRAISAAQQRAASSAKDAAPLSGSPSSRKARQFQPGVSRLSGSIRAGAGGDECRGAAANSRLRGCSARRRSGAQWEGNRSHFLHAAMVCRVAERRPQRCAAESFAARRSPVPTLPPLKNYPATRICAHARHARRCSAPQRSVALAGFAVRGWAAFGAALDLGHTAGHREGQRARRRRKAARVQRRRNEAEVPGCSAPSGGVSGRPRAAGRPLHTSRQHFEV